MKILCNACESAAAAVLCCADDAALCPSCDRGVHAANKLAGKHERLLLADPSAVPNCDICQESRGYFFCLQDRALLCRGCDLAIHAANPYVAAHCRFLLSGIQISPELATQVPLIDTQDDKHGDTNLVKSTQAKQYPRTQSMPSSRTSRPDQNVKTKSPVLLDNSIGVGMGLFNWSIMDEPKEMAGRGDSILPSGGRTENPHGWPMDELYGFMDFSNSFSFTENGSSKADSCKIGSSEDSAHRRSSGEDDVVDAEELLGQVPDITCTVPRLPSPPTASGLHWQFSSSNQQARVTDNAASVPDIGTLNRPYRSPAMASAMKRRRLQR